MSKRKRTSLKTSAEQQAAQGRTKARNEAAALLGADTIPEQNARPTARYDGTGYSRTSTGYERADGSKLIRVSVYMTEAQRTELRRRAVLAGVSVSDMVQKEMGL